MLLLKKLATSPITLLAFLLAGGLAGLLAPSMAVYAAVVARIYLAVVSMAALPLMVVATFFGLRQTLALPKAGRRVLMIIGFALMLVVASSAIGTLFGSLVGTGKGISSDARQHLGMLVQREGGDAANAEMTLLAPAMSTEVGVTGRVSLVPNNFFRTLVDGKAAGIILCSVLFGLAFAALSRERTSSLASIFEATYRTFETIISSANIFIPILVFGMAAFFVAGSEQKTMIAMGSFLFAFCFLSSVLVAISFVIVRKQSGASMAEVLGALKAPALVSLTSSSSTASIPGTIEALSANLGFSRGVAELVAPLSAVFLRAGAALYFALLAVFVANLYGRALSFEDAMLICAGASIAALASAGNNGLANLGYAGLVLSMLKLPIEAAMALFVAIDIVCEGPRNLLTLMFTCVLISWVSKGLPSERLAVKVAANVAKEEAPFRFSFSRTEVIVASVCFLLIGTLVVFVGIGYGMKSSCDTASIGKSVSGVDYGLSPNLTPGRLK